ncbi:MAG: phytanoyl-CoA dioxygenase family protein [Phenylobacterium sp.]|uniref:phytanoyl-CoA dioxygenase family protein n=1 Tax=Phenylobacterium sp. TaxID=1871053 RepID=UPI002734366E|nr:phytanoyl-CoA dioxygenase family protein [Phenylobacterium sp.]MDP1642543.1 phytanoyl-CoA dioxygenase family protein [Phenylobacterium sp.]MDP3118070.1 phytanoyl-CoA dioxygenase family protein [Phenylobacterium sp.]
MTAVRAAAPVTPHPAVADFIAHGAHVFEDLVDPQAAAAVLADIRATRPFDHRLFLSEAEFDADPQHVGVNPRPGRNLLERFEDRLDFVEQAPHIASAIQALLGDGYELLNRKVVCGVPQASVPPWLRTRILGNPVNNLGAYVRPEYRDVTYFYGIDFHQDLIDYRDRPADFLTLYVYLHPVSQLDAPLFLLTGSHQLGGTVFPHDLTRQDAETWTYRDGRGGETAVRQKLLTGPAGFAAIWHACTLHGTQPDAADHERISLRYLLARGREPAGIDEVNQTLRGPLALPQTRLDLAPDGQAVVKGNIVNQV